jgi:2-iminobutanoate/2-iminopropanoate deaminase
MNQEVLMTEHNKKEVLSSNLAPKAVGPYSLGIKAGCFVFLSGQLGLNPETGTLVDGGVEAQTEQALTNIRNILTSNGLDMSRIIKTTVFLKDINDFAKMNLVYAGFFPSDPPARSAVQAAGLPKDGLVEIEAVVFTGE